MNNKGQALVEFVLILPIFIILLFLVIDFGMIISSKNTLENESVDIVNLVKNDKSNEEINNLYKDTLVNIENENNYLKISLTREIDILTPGLNRIIGDPYTVKVERIIYDE